MDVIMDYGVSSSVELKVTIGARQRRDSTVLVVCSGTHPVHKSVNRLNLHLYELLELLP
jgi:hypothetical protein